MSTLASRAAGHTLAERYLVGDPIGTGGMATVYRATDTRLSREVAVKMFRAEATSVNDRLKQEREILLLAKLSHPSLVAVYDSGEHHFGEDSRRYVVMELASQRTLRELCDEGGPLPAEAVAAIGAQIAGALAYVHALGVIHRDVKPANILLADTTGRAVPFVAKLTDFGIAQFVDGSRYTMEGTVIGTASYLSPEQARGDALTPSSDIYSLGLALLEAISGVRAFPGTLVESATARIFKDPQIPAALDPEWRGLLARMTHRDPTLRPTAEQVALELRLLSGQVVALPSESTGETPVLVPVFRSRRARKLAGSSEDDRSRGRTVTRVALTAIAVSACALSWFVGLAMGGAFSG